MATEEPPKKEYSLLAQCVAEAFGTFCIVAGGCGAVAASKYAPASQITNPAVAACFGGSVVMGACSTREISGAHLNPAITATSYALNMPDDSGVSSSKAAAFVFSQVVGATAAAVLNFGMFKNAIRSQEARGEDRGGARRGLGGRVGTTATLLFLINSINDDDLAFPGKDAGPLFVGGTVALLIVATGTISGCGMNPARDFGPRLITALASGPKVATAQPAWIYSAGPLAGAFVGCSAFKAFKGLLDA
ncbi:water channel [Aureococcus anophagefferens]|nr:water channel [Aureococcus anophagefferens]